jgi:hypothetical protein
MNGMSTVEREDEAPRPKVMQRAAVPAKGALFFAGADGKTMFQYTIDASSRIGPVVATKAQQEEYQVAYQRFLADRPKPAADPIKKAEVTVTTKPDA